MAATSPMHPVIFEPTPLALAMWRFLPRSALERAHADDEASVQAQKKQERQKLQQQQQQQQQRQQQQKQQKQQQQQQEKQQLRPLAPPNSEQVAPRHQQQHQQQQQQQQQRQQQQQQHLQQQHLQQQQQHVQVHRTPFPSKIQSGLRTGGEPHAEPGCWKHGPAPAEKPVCTQHGSDTPTTCSLRGEDEGIERYQSRDEFGRIWGAPAAFGAGQCLDCPAKAKPPSSYCFACQKRRAAERHPVPGDDWLARLHETLLTASAQVKHGNDRTRSEYQTLAEGLDGSLRAGRVPPTLQDLLVLVVDALSEGHISQAQGYAHAMLKESPDAWKQHRQWIQSLRKLLASQPATVAA